MSTGRRLFGTDGMRGVANLEPMTSATVMRLGMAIAARLRQPGRHTRIAIGKDTRLSGYMFESALAAGIVSMGADVWLTGPLPTPGIAFITALGDFVVSVVLYTYETRPISIEILSALRVQELGIAAAYGVVLVVLSAAAFLIWGEREPASSGPV